MAATDLTATDVKEVVKRSYNQIAPAYLSFTLSRSSPRLRYLDRLLRTLSPGSNVLELGCGAGVPVTQTLCQHENVGTVIANDISERQIELARERCLQWSDKLEFISGDMMALDFEEGQFHGIAAFYSIFHLPGAEQPEMIRKIHQWLKPGGILVCNFGAKETSDDENVKQWNYFQADMFWSGLGVGATKKMISQAGFDLLVAEVRNSNEDLDPGKESHASDPDRDVEFLWIVARKFSEQTI
jgi:ubiquinone/menaquinone biosynthesis C-methylase UbiE